MRDIVLVVVVCLLSCISNGSAEQEKKPCADPMSRQFDFWVGDWEVKTPDGKAAGTSSIQLILDNCIIFENWTGASGYHGKSLNVYNSTIGKWQQFWVDNQGGSLYFAGEFRDTALWFQGESIDRDGNKLLEHLTFFPLAEDHVRQLWEQSKDGGKTWVVVFDGHYYRKK